MEGAGFSWLSFASLFSAWAQDGSQAASTFSCFSFFTVLATERQYLPGPCRKVTFPKKTNEKKIQEEDKNREQSHQERAVFFPRHFLLWRCRLSGKMSFFSRDMHSRADPAPCEADAKLAVTPLGPE